MNQNSLPISLTKHPQILGWFWWAFQLLFLPLLLTEGNRYLGTPLSEAQLNFLFFCVNFTGTTLVLGTFCLVSCAQGLNNVFRTLQSAFFAYVLFYLVNLLLGFGVIYLFPDYVNQNDSSILRLLEDAPVLMRIGVQLLVPVTEELLYRGLIFGSIHSRSRLLAYLVSALLFALVHVLGYAQEPVFFVISLVQYLPAGLCLAWAYERSGSILAPILMHIAINQISLSVLR